ncbi:MAG TPA: UbiA family prenyltransferase [Candidatus Eisenbacteria bacterium]|nr:UbiA family prenyltransferase [Candidatus Eisenbacteria bacterium]
MTQDLRDGMTLYVDLDGTLVRSDTLWESLLALARRRPWSFAALPGWLAGGKAAFKRRLAKAVLPDPALLPYDKDVLALVHARRERGGRVVLATAADRAIADEVSRHLGIFDGVLASDGTTNNAGAAKRDAIIAHAEGAPFEYLGDGRDDEAVRKAAVASTIVQRPRATFGSVAAALRVRQWLKNLLVFVPLGLSHRLADPALLAAAFAAFASFSLCASAVYVLNDLWDLEADRRHPVKRARPLASGSLGIPDGLALAVCALAAALALAASSLSPLFVGLLAGYLVITTAYTFFLKRFAVLDVLVIAVCYAYRLVAGSAATGIVLSGWLVVFSLFFFLSLAFLKRYAELAMRKAGGLPAEAGRGYASGDLGVLRLLGIASAVAAVFVMSLYVTNPNVTVLYSRPPVLWLAALATMYWLGRIWLLAGRGAIKDDPFSFTVADGPSYATAALMALTLVLAS